MRNIATYPLINSGHCENSRGRYLVVILAESLLQVFRRIVNSFCHFTEPTGTITFKYTKPYKLYQQSTKAVFFKPNTEDLRCTSFLSFLLSGLSEFPIFRHLNMVLPTTLHYSAPVFNQLKKRSL